MFLDVVIREGMLTLIIIVLIVTIIIIYSMISDRNEKIKNQLDKYHELEISVTKKDGELQTFKSEMERKAQESALGLLEKWKNSELEGYKKVADEYASEAALVQLEKWIMENNQRIRKDAANRSVRNVLGKVTEHLIPFSEAMSMFNPKDIRFIGSPIDLIVFEGAEQLTDVSIHFIEVKTGTSALSKRQQLIQAAIKAGRVHWKRVNMKDFGDEVNDALRQ